MQIKHYLLITILFILGKATMATAQTCNLPASDTFVNVINLPTYKTYTFSPVAGAIGYEAKVTNLATNVTQTLILPGSATGFSVNTQPGPHNAQLRAICPNNIPSENVAEEDTDDTIIIMDLVGGYQNQCTPSEIKCEHSTLTPFQPYDCTAPLLSETYQFSFKYSGSLAVSYVYGNIINATNPVQSAIPLFQIQQVYETSNGWVFEETKVINSATNNTAIRIRPQGSTTERLDISADFSNGQIVLKLITANERGAAFSDFKLYTCRGGGSGGGAERDNGQHEATGEDLGTEKALNVLVSPNPFNDNLTLTMEAPETGNVSVQLYNLTGGLQKSLEITPAELTNNTYTIPTADLATGMYIMQVSTEQGVRHTSKVFKL